MDEISPTSPSTPKDPEVEKKYKLMLSLWLSFCVVGFIWFVTKVLKGRQQIRYNFSSIEEQLKRMQAVMEERQKAMDENDNSAGTVAAANGEPSLPLCENGEQKPTTETTELDVDIEDIRGEIGDNLTPEEEEERETLETINNIRRRNKEMEIERERMRQMDANHTQPKDEEIEEQEACTDAEVIAAVVDASVIKKDN